MSRSKGQNRITDQCGRLVKIKSKLTRLQVAYEIRHLKQKVAEGEARSTELKQSLQTILARLNRSMNPEILAESLGRANAILLIRSEAAYRSVCNNEMELAASNLVTLAEKKFRLVSEIKSKSDQSCRHFEREKACVKHERTKRAHLLATLDSREQIEIEELFAQTIFAGGKLWAI